MGEPICLHSAPTKGHDQSSGGLTLYQQRLPSLNCLVVGGHISFWDFCLVLFYPTLVSLFFSSLLSLILPLKHKSSTVLSPGCQRVGSPPTSAAKLLADEIKVYL